jgi:hypothetical protein
MSASTTTVRIRRCIRTWALSLGRGVPEDDKIINVLVSEIVPSMPGVLEQKYVFSHRLLMEYVAVNGVCVQFNGLVVTNSQRPVIVWPPKDLPDIDQIEISILEKFFLSWEKLSHCQEATICAEIRVR